MTDLAQLELDLINAIGAAETAAAVEELREEVSLQVILRMEEEVTKTLQLVAGLYARLGHQVSVDAELREMLGPLDPDKIEKDLIDQIQQARRPSKKARANAKTVAGP